MFGRKNPADFSYLASDTLKTKKEVLIAECERRQVPIYVDDPTETSAGPYAAMRAVVSEAEMQTRLYAKDADDRAVRAEKRARRAELLAVCALVIALGSLGRTMQWW